MSATNLKYKFTLICYYRKSCVPNFYLSLILL